MQTTEPRTPHAYDVVSAGTLNSEDLIPAYASYLRGLGYDLSELEAEYPWMDDDYYDDVAAEEQGYCFDSLTERLEEIAPEYVYFGASEGDGACFGFWPLIPNDDYDVVRIDAGTPWHYCMDTEQTAVFGEHARIVTVDYVLTVSDHGDATLYRADTGEEVWSTI